MKLLNKETGEIGYLCFANWNNPVLIIMDKDGVQLAKYNSLAELNAEWEDYEEEPEIVWFIDTANETINTIDKCITSFDQEIGNYFNTLEEAEKAVEKLKAWKRLKDNGFTIRQWRHTPDMNLTTGSFINIKGFIPEVMKNIKDLDLLFSGGEE